MDKLRPFLLPSPSSSQSSNNNSSTPAVGPVSNTSPSNDNVANSDSPQDGNSSRQNSTNNYHDCHYHNFVSGLSKEKGLYFVVNSTQSLGADFNVKDFGIDQGAIFMKRKYLRDVENLKPPFFSQFGQKRRENFDNNIKINMSNTATRFELGTPHFPNIVALNAAPRYVSQNWDKTY
jgi:hypothetical protein